MIVSEKSLVKWAPAWPKDWNEYIIANVNPPGSETQQFHDNKVKYHSC